MIRPDEDLRGGPGGLISDPGNMKWMVTKGVTCCDQFVAKLSATDTGGWSHF